MSSRYWVIPNYYAPKWKRPEMSVGKNLHAVLYDRCNFRCGFCNFAKSSQANYREYSREALYALFAELMGKGEFFKFTGGEPTLNPNLERDLGMVKSLGGSVFLDTNGSLPHVIERVSDKGLVNVAGISLKGLSADLAQATAGVSNARYAWDNVLASTNVLSERGVDVIVTMVFHAGVPLDGMREFAGLFAGNGRIRLKINNLLSRGHQAGPYESADPAELQSKVEELLRANPDLAGRLVLVNSNGAVTKRDEVIFY